MEKRKTLRVISMMFILLMIIRVIDTVNAKNTDFVIENNVLTNKYNGAGGNVKIPEGVTTIGN